MIVLKNLPELVVVFHVFDLLLCPISFQAVISILYSVSHLVAKKYLFAMALVMFTTYQGAPGCCG